VGGARTALFNWLFARKHHGTFILRFEDTDIERNRPELVKPIMESFRWLDLLWDEGPYFQSQRFELYRQYAERLLHEGKAYRCYCTPQELEEKRKQAMAAKRKPKYDGRCRNLSPEEQERYESEGRKPALRIKAPETGMTVVEDSIRGHVEFDNTELDDFIIFRSDGRPTYNFAVVVDDVTMGITHVIRADEHLNNTPKQIVIYEALGYALPQFAHVPMVLAKDRTKLSKRHGATAVFEFRDRGILPEALVNHLARLGWSYGDQEIFTREELIEKFSLEAVHPAAAIFDDEKLLWLNHHYIKTGNQQRLGHLVREFAVQRGLFPSAEAKDISEDRWSAVVDFLKERKRTLVELAEGAVPFLTDRLSYDPKAVEKFLTSDRASLLRSIANVLRTIPSENFRMPILEETVRLHLESQGLSLKDAAQPCRVALTGLTVGPGLFETMQFLGKARVIERLERAIEKIQGVGSAAR